MLRQSVDYFAPFTALIPGNPAVLDFIAAEEFSYTVDAHTAVEVILFNDSEARRLYINTLNV